MPYEIIKNIPQFVQLTGRPKTEERTTMEKLEVGDGFVIVDVIAARRARDACRVLRPKIFSIKKMRDGQGWQVRRDA